MSALFGGTYAQLMGLAARMGPQFGATETRRTHQITSPAPGVDSLSPWLRLVPHPLGGDDLVLRAYIAWRDYQLLGTRSGKGAEFNVRENLGPWGDPYTYYWRFIVDPLWRTYSGESGTICLQVHEGGTGSPPGQPPNFYAALSNGQLVFRQANDTYTNSRTIYSTPFEPGQEFEVFLAALWRDGIHAVPGSTGWLQLIVNGVVVWEDRQAQNCWALPGDVYGPFMVAGVYVPGNDDSWWQNNNRTVYHVGQAMGDGSETFNSLRAIVARQLGRRNRQLIGAY